jgi:hypothetical protein
VQELGFAAKQSGGDLGDMALGLTRLQDALATMAGGGSAGEKILKAFTTLGVSVDDLRSKQPDQLLDSIATTLAATGVNSARTAAMLDLFGKAGGKLIPILTELNAKTKEFKEAGLGLTKDDISALDDAGDMLDKLGLKAKVIGSQAALGLKMLASALTNLGSGGILGGDSQILEVLMGKDRDSLGVHRAQAAFDKALRARGGDSRWVPGSPTGFGPTPKKDDEEERNIAAGNASYEQRHRATAATAPYSDALLRVGNFLGQGATQKMNTIAQRTASATESIDRKMDTLIRNLTTSGNITD